MSICRGCGAVLQSTDPNAAGYTPKTDAEYCQRCFRLMHYDDLRVDMKRGIDPDVVLDRVEKMDALVLWVVDLFDFEAGMIPGLARKIGNKDIVLVCTKKDILPKSLNHEKTARFVFARLKEMGIHVKGLILASPLHKVGIEEIRDAVNMYSKGRPVAVIGRANSGKSTLINNLIGKDILTSSRYPGTTLDFNELEIDGIRYIDTPGIEVQHSIQMEVKNEDLRTILPDRTIKPRVFQVNGDQSFAIGGLARLDVLGADHASVVWYLSGRLNIHRCKAAGADAFWKKHYGELLVPAPLENDFHTLSVHKNLARMDAVVDGLGWACISGQISTIAVRAPKNVNITFRKAMI